MYNFFSLTNLNIYRYKTKILTSFHFNSNIFKLITNSVEKEVKI